MRVRRQSDPQEGMALIGVMVLMMILSVAISAISVSGRTELTIARRHEVAAIAQTSAEAGLNHAIEAVLATLNQWQASGFASGSAAATSLLVGPDGASGTADADADNGSLEASGLTRPPGQLTLPGLAGGAYEAQVFDEDDPDRGLTLSAGDVAVVGENGDALSDGNASLVVRAIGRSPSGASTTLEATIRPLTLPGIVSNDSFRMHGNATIDGTSGAIHSNADLELDGSVSVSGSATASNDYSESGNPGVGGQSGGGQAPLPIQAIDASDYRDQADFILQADGSMTDKSGGVVCDASGDSQACQDAGYLWRFNGADGWRLNGNDLPAAGNHRTYYAETDLEFSGNPGSSGNPLDVTIIAEGSIDLSGNPTLEANMPGVLFVTDGDLDITGNVTQVGSEALILVREQMRLKGNSQLMGQIFIEDDSDSSDLVTTSTMGGNAQVTSNAALGPTAFTVSGWREIR